MTRKIFLVCTLLLLISGLCFATSVVGNGVGATEIVALENARKDLVDQCIIKVSDYRSSNLKDLNGDFHSSFEQYSFQSNVFPILGADENVVFDKKFGYKASCSLSQRSALLYEVRLNNLYYGLIRISNDLINSATLDEAKINYLKLTYILRKFETFQRLVNKLTDKGLFRNHKLPINSFELLIEYQNLLYSDANLSAFVENYKAFELGEYLKANSTIYSFKDFSGYKGFGNISGKGVANTSEIAIDLARKSLSDCFVINVNNTNFSYMQEDNGYINEDYSKFDLHIRNFTISGAQESVIKKSDSYEACCTLTSSTAVLYVVKLNNLYQAIWNQINKLKQISNNEALKKDCLKLISILREYEVYQTIILMLNPSYEVAFQVLPYTLVEAEINYQGLLANYHSLFDLQQNADYGIYSLQVQNNIKKELSLLEEKDSLEREKEKLMKQELINKKQQTVNDILEALKKVKK